MLQSYFTIAVRNLLKNKVFSAINIMGLAVGITCCILLTLYILDEFSYERHFSDYRSIYRVTSTLKTDAWTAVLPASAPPTLPALVREFPEIEVATRVVSPPDVPMHYLTYHDKAFFENKGYLVDSTFFDVFDYGFAEGSPATALDARSSVVLSHDVAAKFFGNQSALDQLIVINSGPYTDTCRVTGVLQPYSQPSQIDAGFYMTLHSNGWGRDITGITDWAQTFIYTFIKLKPGVSPEKLEARFPAMMARYEKDRNTMGFSNLPGLQPLEDMHLFSADRFSTDSAIRDIGTSGNINSVYILSSICLFILLIACINFMNLTTARAFQRAGEVGIRKSLGANRGMLIRQFLGESLAIVVIAMFLSIGLVQLALPLFNGYAQKELTINTTNISWILGALGAISLFTALIAGSYPAFFLSAFQPVRVLRERYFTSNASNGLRKTLVVFQFVVAITLISSIFVIRQQMNYMQEVPLGFASDYRITIPLRTGEAKSGYINLKDRYLQLSGVSQVSATSALPSSPTIRGIPLHPSGATAESGKYHYWLTVDENYFKTLGIQIVQGRDLRAEIDGATFGAPITPVLVNEASLRETGIKPDKAIGSKLEVNLAGMHMTFRIEGVVSDFHQFSMHSAVSPMIFQIPNPRTDYNELCLTVDAANYTQTLQQLQDTWKQVIPNTVFEYSLLSDNIKRQYEADQRTFAVITIFTSIAIVISCLGLYGLSIYTAERRVKEIGIRKVMGASVSSIVRMLSMDFIKLVGVAFILAVPIGYYAMNRWLESFAYKIELSATVFVLAGVVSIGIAWITIGFEAVRAALGKPVDSLRSE